MVQAERLFIVEGCGMYCWWSMGALRHHTITTGDQFVAVSGGTIAAAVSICHVDLHRCLLAAPDKTATISQLYSVLNQWLEDILPADAHLLCSNRLIIASRDMIGRIQYTDQFETRMALLDAIMTACNLPLHTGFVRRVVLNGMDAIVLPTSWFVRPRRTHHFPVIRIDPLRCHIGATYSQALSIPTKQVATAWIHAGDQYAAGPALRLNEWVRDQKTVSGGGVRWGMIGAGIGMTRFLLFLFHGNRNVPNGLIAGILGQHGFGALTSVFIGWMLADTLHSSVYRNPGMMVHHVIGLTCAIMSLGHYRIRNITVALLSSVLYTIATMLSRQPSLVHYRSFLRLVGQAISFGYRFQFFTRAVWIKGPYPLARVGGCLMLGLDTFWAIQTLCTFL
jgi:hypothetical protein